MNPRHLILVLTAFATVAGLAGSASADLLCKTRKGVVVVRSACKPRETRLDPDALGLRGSQGPKGDPGQSVQGPSGATGAPGPGLVVKDANGTFVGLGGGDSIVRRINGELFSVGVKDTGFITEQPGSNTYYYYFSGDCTGVPYYGVYDGPQPSDQLQYWHIHFLSVPTPEGANAYYPSGPAASGSVYSLRFYVSDPSQCPVGGGATNTYVLVAPNYCCSEYTSAWTTGDFYPVTQINLGDPILGLVPPFHVEGP